MFDFMPGFADARNVSSLDYLDKPFRRFTSHGPSGIPLHDSVPPVSRRPSATVKHDLVRLEIHNCAPHSEERIVRKLGVSGLETVDVVHYIWDWIKRGL